MHAIRRLGAVRGAAGRILAAAAALVLAGCAARYGVTDPPPPLPPPEPPAPVCWDCFWDHLGPGLRDQVAQVYAQYASDDPLVMAEAALVRGRVIGDPRSLCSAAEAFEEIVSSDPDAARRLLAAETIAFTAAECGRSPSDAFRRAAAAARDHGDAFKEAVYAEVAAGTFRPRVAGAVIGRHLQAPPGTTGYVLGGTVIRVPRGARVAAQVERTVRDWLSYQLRARLGDAPADARDLLDWHEGARLRDLDEAAEIDVIPLSGALAVRDGGRWLAADEHGAFRFEVLADKVQYPTTRVHGDLALLVDTHGVSSLVEQAVRRKADLVVACGDHPEKMKAAYYLALLGIPVWFPCDRFVADLLGHDAPAALIGSAPVRQEGDAAVIGGRPVRFSVEEPVVVQDTRQGGEMQYYDAPARYFRRLAEALPLRLEIVEVQARGRTGEVGARARALGAEAIAVRVWTEDDAAPVRAWLADSPRHRAVLFHTAAYAPGYRLFQQFPGQTTFGDPRPRFLSADGTGNPR